MKQISIIFIILFCSCSNDPEADQESRIRNLEASIDSLESDFQDSLAFIYADSLIQVDPNNTIALWTLGKTSFNNQDFNNATTLLKQHIELKPNDTSALLLLAWSFDELDSQAIAYQYYEQLIPIISQSSEFKWMLPRIVTITKGKTAGLESLKENKNHLSDQFYYQMKNDISNYEDEGMKAFYPLLNLPPYDFYLKIPENLFDSGQLNSSSKIQTFFAKQGINVMFKASDSKNKACIISTSEKYLKSLENFDSLNIKRL
jgi:tetratricopeptide (TPR) repeat protein